ncbi:glycerate kinase [Nocardia vinacea]|uniref:Glycerate kinase n=1 Tax=Nocardia vinacea TaxID=96468 RepID=A0ABZ1Z7E0_9NOCA|nr:glycerate kinase [Nocardia vinacea]
MRVLVAPDKFKGSLSAADVAEHLAAGLASVGIDCRQLPLADGGDGSVDATIAAGFTPHPITTAGATGTPHRGRIAVNATTAVVEVANTCGLATLPSGRTAPLDASSLGVGQAIEHALRHRPTKLILALGGSASTDGGMGMLAALGFTFYDAAGRLLRAGGRTLPQIDQIDASRAVNLSGIEILIAGDVTNPLSGPNGAAHTYGPQKGADPATVDYLDAGLDNLVEVFTNNGYPKARALADSAGAGSAGGIAFAAMLLGARMVSGAEYFLDLLDFDNYLTNTDLVVTGEGSIDEQTEHGKLLTVLARRSHPVPVIAVAGRNTLPRSHWQQAGFSRIYAISDYTDHNTATDRALTGELLTYIGHEIGRTNHTLPLGWSSPAR